MKMVALGDLAGLPPKGMEVPTEQVANLCSLFGLWRTRNIIITDPPQKPFKSDGCSLFPDKWRNEFYLYPWCFEHDIAYWCGYPKSSDEWPRLAADIRLMERVAVNVDVGLAEKMFKAVRLGGGADLSLPWRWGFGRV